MRRLLPLALIGLALSPAPGTAAPDPQAITERALADGLARARSAGVLGSAGAVVVLDLRERAVVGLASLPGTDNPIRAVPAGSVMKPFVGLAALDHARDPIPCPAVLRIGNDSIRNRREEGTLSLPEAIARSCNTVFAALSARLWDIGDRRAIPRTFVRFGFGRPTGLASGEDPGLVADPPSDRGQAMALAIGQGPLAVTPLQVARAYAALAGAPARGWTAIDGSLNDRTVRPAHRTQIAPIIEGLRLAVQHGTAEAPFRGSPIDVAGKTGTAEAGDVTPWAWFSGFAPANDPRYVVTVMVERGGSGAVSAAPIARAIFEQLLDAAHEPPLPFPPAAAVLLLLPLVAGRVSAGAGALCGFPTGLAAGWLTGSSLAGNAAAFAAAAWVAGIAWRRGARLALPVAGALGTIVMQAEGRSVGWFAARLTTTSLIAFTVGLVLDRSAGTR